jgi:photosystem II stability/assembly factor-like uncharacterized protein
MKNQIIKKQPGRRPLRTVFRWLYGFALVFSCAVSVQGADVAKDAIDLLLMPAEKSVKAPFSLLMDIAKAGDRLVAVGERGHILYSDLDGKDWLQAEVPVSVTLTAVDFATDRMGWAVGHDGVVLHTEDGGQTWRKQLDGKKINSLVLSQLKQLVEAKNEKLNNAGPEMGEDQKAALEKELEDLGYFLGDAEQAFQEGPTRPLMDLCFKNEREGIVIGAFGIILKTIDGGESWKPILDRMDNPDGFHYYALARSGEDLFIAGESGILFRSEDFGENWKRLHSGYDGSYFGIIGSPEGGFVTAFGLRGNISCSYDRGETWVPAPNASKASLSGGAFLADGSFCLAGVDGVLIRSTDKGKTFAPLPVKFPGSISLIEAKHGILAVTGLRGVTRIEVNPSGSTSKGNS